LPLAGANTSRLTPRHRRYESLKRAQLNAGAEENVGPDKRRRGPTIALLPRFDGSAEARKGVPQTHHRRAFTHPSKRFSFLLAWGARILVARNRVGSGEHPAGRGRRKGTFQRQAGKWAAPKRSCWQKLGWGVSRKGVFGLLKTGHGRRHGAPEKLSCPCRVLGKLPSPLILPVPPST